MIDAVYPSVRGAALRGELDLVNDDINVAALDDTYTDMTGDKFLADLPGEAIIATSETLTAGTVSDDGVFDADNAVFSGVDADKEHVRSLVLFKDTATAATSLLLACINTGVRDIPIDADPNGENITVVWPDEGIFGL